jgi:hypothetical protein
MPMLQDYDGFYLRNVPNGTVISEAALLRPLNRYGSDLINLSW